MVDCKYCGEEFDDEHELHLHMGEEHEDELNSHEKDKVKKARRKQEDESNAKMRKRKQLAGWGFAAVIGLIFIGYVGSQLLSMVPGGTAEFDLEDRHYLGEEDAPVEVVVFEDYQCDYCGAFNAQVYPHLEENHIETGEIRYYVYNYPVLGGTSVNAAIAAECVREQDEEQYWNFHKAVYQYQNNLDGSTDYLVNLAEDHTEGLDYEELGQCISSRDTSDRVNADRQVGQQSGVTGTPTVFVNGEQVNWDYSHLQAAIRTELASE